MAPSWRHHGAITWSPWRHHVVIMAPSRGHHGAMMAPSRRHHDANHGGRAAQVSASTRQMGGRRAWRAPTLCLDAAGAHLQRVR
eukprot:7382908-Prymnesium_polylepis.1